MALELHIAGPGLDVRRRVAAGEPALILGRDSDCAVCLPDPERSISRRHLSLWNDGDLLHFHVLSVVNGVDSAAGELPPGARGVLAPGEALGLSAFRIGVQALPDAQPAAGPADPWAEFARAAAVLVPDNGTDTVPGTPEADPFGDWGFQSTFGPGTPGGGLRADAHLPAVDLQPFFAGLGPEGPEALTNGELETLGRLTRIALQGLLQAAAAARGDVPPGRRPGAPGREPNPLRTDTPLEAKLSYLLAGQAAAPGSLSPERALVQVVAELCTHLRVLDEAMVGTVQEVVEEFEPDALKQRLLGGGARLFGSARAWDAFARHYAQQAAADPAWARQLLDRYFARAYARALVRAKRDTPARS